MGTVSVIARTSGIEVLFMEGTGDTVLVTFNGLGTSADGITMTGASIAEHLGWPIIGFMSRVGNWFPPDEMEILARMVHGRLGSFTNRVGYGFSMGGYGAIKHSRLLNLTHVLAMSPQWSIHPEVAPWERRYLSNLQPWHIDMQIVPSDCSGHVFVVYDDFDEDRRHAEKILAAYSMHALVVRYAGHETFRLFLSSEVMGDVFSAILRQDVVGLRAMIRLRRRLIPHFKSRLLFYRAMKFLGRNQYEAAESWGRLALDAEDPAPGVGFLLCRTLVRLDRFAEAETVIRSEIARSPELVWLGMYLAEALEGLGRFAEALSVIRTVHTQLPGLHGAEPLLLRLESRLRAPPELPPATWHRWGPGGIERPRILVLGASNELRREGYPTWLGSSGFPVLNLSIGACGSTAGVFSLLKHGVPRAEVAVLSYEINDNGLVGMGIRSPSQIREALSWVFARLRGAGITPIMLILPRLENGQFARTPCQDLHRTIAEEHEVHVLDVARMVDMAEANGCSLAARMDDAVHMGAELARIVGRWIGIASDLILQSPAEFGIAHAMLPDYRLISARCFSDAANITTRSSSAMTSELALLDGARTVTLAVGPHEYVHSVVLNSSAPGSILLIASKTRPVTKALCFLNDTVSARNFTLQVVDIRDAPTGSPTGIELSIADRHARVTEPTLHAVESPPDSYGLLEMEAVVIAKTEPTATQHLELRRPGLALDILEALKNSALSNLRELGIAEGTA